MQRTWIALLLGMALCAPTVMAQGRGQRQGGGTQLRQRIHQPGTALQSGPAVQQRQRKRDGTGVNCTGGPCLQTRMQTQDRTQTQTQTKTQTQQEKPPTPSPKQ